MSNKPTTQTLMIEAKKLGKHPISFSQLSLYNNCPWAWKLRYIDKVPDSGGNIYTLFGSAIHTVIQTYLTNYFSKSMTIKATDAIDLNAMLLDEMKKELIGLRKQSKEPDSVSSKEEMTQFYYEGCEILNYIKKRKGLYFDKKREVLVGIETPLLVETDSHVGIMFLGFLDIVVADPISNKIRIIDIKTSTKGWRKEKKADFITSAQLILYKKYYAKRYKVNPDDIEIEFFIVKRQLYEDTEFPQKRIQIHKPASGKVNMSKAEKLISKFTEIFDQSGKVIPNTYFPKVGGSACKWCQYENRTDDICPKSERMPS